MYLYLSQNIYVKHFISIFCIEQNLCRFNICQNLCFDLKPFFTLNIEYSISELVVFTFLFIYDMDIAHCLIGLLTYKFGFCEHNFQRDFFLY